MKDLTHGPRPRFWWMLWRLGGMFPLVLAIITVVLSVTSFDQLKRGLEFEAQGVEVMAEVVDRTTREVPTAERTKTEYEVELSFIARRDLIEAKRKVTRAQYNASDIGSTRTVRYLPRNPYIFEFKVGETFANGGIARWLALAFGLATLAALWWTGRQAVDAIRARKFGAVEHVSVTKIIEGQGKNSKYRLQWLDKNKQTGTSLSSGKRARFDPYPVHSKVEVFRGAKGRAWWVGDVGPRADARSLPSVGKP